MIFKKFEIKAGPELNFLTSLPVSNKAIFQKPTLLLHCFFEGTESGQITAEIPHLEGYSQQSINDLLFQTDALNDLLSETKLEDFLKTIYQNHNRIPTPLVHALEIINFKATKTKPATYQIPVRLLNKTNGKNVKLKINPNTLSSVLKELENIPSGSFVTIDANLQLKANDWQIFFKKFDTLKFDQHVNISIEEPMSYEELVEEKNTQLFKNRNISIAVDESLPNWIEEKLEYTEILERLKTYDLIVYKPGMISLYMLQLLLQRSTTHNSSQIILSCLYEGPWNLEYFFYLYSSLGLKIPAGLHPLIHIKENATHLQLSEETQTLQLK
jgi:hypothetical protein